MEYLTKTATEMETRWAMSWLGMLDGVAESVAVLACGKNAVIEGWK